MTNDIFCNLVKQTLLEDADDDLIELVSSGSLVSIRFLKAFPTSFMTPVLVPPVTNQTPGDKEIKRSKADWNADMICGGKTERFQYLHEVPVPPVTSQMSWNKEIKPSKADWNTDKVCGGPKEKFPYQHVVL